MRESIDERVQKNLERAEMKLREAAYLLGKEWRQSYSDRLQWIIDDIKAAKE